LRKLDRYTFKCANRRGPLTCSSVYSLKDDILSEEQDGDDEDSIHNEGDAAMDEQVGEDEEILSERSESAVAAEMEEEKLFTDNRSV
jgi:hypothetical protein